MKYNKGFTLLEMLLSVVISSVIVVGLSQLYRSVMNGFATSQDLMKIDRKVSLLFHQMERDLSSAYVPFLEMEKKTDKEKAAAEKKAKEQRKMFFVGMVVQQFNPALKVQGKRAELMSYVSFICTNPLQVVDEQRQRLVRVVYELVEDKTNRVEGQESYRLIRRETTDLENVRAKVSEFEAPAQKQAIRSYVVADNIKGAFIEYSMMRESKDEKSEEKKEITLFKWGDRDDTRGVVPQKVSVWLDVWNDTKRRSFRFHTVFPILSYPTQKIKPQAKAADTAKKPAAPKKAAATKGTEETKGSEIKSSESE